MGYSYEEIILGLPGTAAERQWLTEHLEVLSVRERTALSAAMSRQPPQDMAGAVNCLLSLDDYEVRGHVGSYEELGEYLLFEECVPLDQQAYFDLSALGRMYEDHTPACSSEAATWSIREISMPQPMTAELSPARRLRRGASG
jgi:hypothetical protein